MLDNHDHNGDPRIFVITGESIRDGWRKRIDGLKAHVAAMTGWIAGDIPADDKKDLAEDLDRLTFMVELEEFQRNAVAPGNIRLSRYELDDIYRGCFQAHRATTTTLEQALVNCRVNRSSGRALAFLGDSLAKVPDARGKSVERTQEVANGEASTRGAVEPAAG